MRLDVVLIEGDGIGPEVAQASVSLIERAVALAYGGERRVEWMLALAGEAAVAKGLEPMPDETVELIGRVGRSLKGPLTTPVGSGYRSPNVELRKRLNLYACFRPIRYFDGVPSPLADPKGIDMAIFRENTEDVYAQIEWTVDEAADLRDTLKSGFSVELSDDTALTLKPMSEHATRRLVRFAIDWSLEHGRERLTVVHKGNIMKATEGAFWDWAKGVASEYRPRVAVDGESEASGAELVMTQRIADAAMHDLVLRPQSFDVIVAPNLNGDYISDLCAALVGGLGVCGGANLGDRVGVFEAVHGTAPDIAGKGIANPSSFLLSAALMLEFSGWHEAAKLLTSAVEAAFKRGCFTLDLAKGSALSTSEFASKLAEEMEKLV